MTMMSTEFMLRVFGAVSLEGGGYRVAKFPTQRSALILARLVLTRGQRIARDELAEVLWPDDYRDVTQTRLRQELRRTRQALGDLAHILNADRQWIELSPGVVTSDVAIFDEALADASVTAELAERVEHLKRAIELATGPLLASYQDPWVLAARREYDEKSRRGWLALADALQALGRDEEALTTTLDAVRRHSLDSETNAALIRRLVARGQIARARQTFFEFDAMLFREFGTHAPVAIQDLLTASPVPQKPKEKAPILRPAPVVGRDETLDAIQAALARPGAVVILVGIPGVGKNHVLRESTWRFSFGASGLPVQVGGQAGSVSDGLYVIDDESPDLEARITAAAARGWRVFATSSERLGGEGFAEIAILPLPTPPLNEMPEASLANPSVRILLSQSVVPPNSPRELAALAELARQLDGIPAFLKAFGARLVAQSPSEVLADLEGGLRRYLDRGAIAGYRERLSRDEWNALLALSLLDGASSSLAWRLVSGGDPAEIWPALERKSLIVIEGQGSARRFRVPRPIAFAVRESCGPADEAVVAGAWEAVADWAYALSRKLMGPDQGENFDRIEAELDNLSRGIAWAIEHDPRLAAHFVVGTWRTLSARGNAAVNGPLLFRAAEVGAHLLDPWFGCEAWIGPGMVLSIGGLRNEAEPAFLNAIRLGEEMDSPDRIAWAAMNYAVNVVAYMDQRGAAEMLKRESERAVYTGLRDLALAEYASALASLGEIEEAIQVGEKAFAGRMLINDPTGQAQAHLELAALYRCAGRPEIARSFMREGIRRLRQTGVRDMLFEALLAYVTNCPEEPDVEQALEEARTIAARIGATPKHLDVSRARLSLAYRRHDSAATIAATEDALRLTSQTQSVRERERSLRLLAKALESFDKIPYANALRGALREHFEGPLHERWRALLTMDSHATICMLAAVLVREALG